MKRFRVLLAVLVFCGAILGATPALGEDIIQGPVVLPMDIEVGPISIPESDETGGGGLIPMMLVWLAVV